MNIVILGAGSIGSYLAHILSQEGHNIVVIDLDGKALERVGRYADVATRQGSGTDWQLLEELTEIAPDIFIAMSSDDETNLVACSIAKNLGYPKTVARVRGSAFLDHSRLDFGRLFCVDHILGTDVIIANDIFKSIRYPGHSTVENFAHGAVEMRTVIIPENFEQAGQPLANIKLSDNLLVGLIRRKIGDSPETIIFPKGQDHLIPGDEATLIGEAKVMRHLSDLFGLEKHRIHSVVIVGGSSIAVHLCSLLHKQKIEIKIIEQDEAKCQELSKKFPHATVLNHDVTDLAFLEEERIQNFDMFVACTPSPEMNILAAGLAKQAGCKEVMVLVSDESFAPILQQLGINHAISERTSIASHIHAVLHDDAVISVASLYDNRARIMEVKISADSEIVGSPIADLSSSLPQNFLLALIENRTGVTIPRGASVLAPGDTAIVICSPDTALEVEKLL